jgi:hypothetical protein
MILSTLSVALVVSILNGQNEDRVRNIENAICALWYYCKPVYEGQAECEARIASVIGILV